MSRTAPLVELIGSTRPEDLERLKRRYPDLAAELSPNRVMGAGAEPQRTDDRHAGLLDLARLDIDVLRDQVDKLLAHVLGRMRLASRLKLAGAVVASTSGLCLAALALWQHQNAYGDLVAAAFSFFAGLVSILADQVIRSPSGLLIGSSEEHAKILAIRMGTEKIALRIARDPIFPISEDDLVGIIDQLGEFSMQVYRYQHS